MKLDEARFKSRLTQYALFLKTGISPSKISLIENGLLIPGEKDRQALAEALEISPEDLEFEKAPRIGRAGQ